MPTINLGQRRLTALFGGDHVSAQARRFILVGVLNTAFGYAAFSLVTLLGAKPLLALLIANGVGVAFNFHTARRIVFRRRDSGRPVRFTLLYGVLMLVNWVALKGLLALGSPTLAAQAFLVLPMAGLSFLGQRQFAVRHVQETPER
ncbi:MAG: GtrA family protein [Caulobacteraceae bacterium]